MNRLPVLAGHIARPRPVTVQDLRGGLRVFIIAFHDAGTLGGQARRSRGATSCPCSSMMRVPGNARPCRWRRSFRCCVHTQNGRSRGQWTRTGRSSCRRAQAREIFEPALDKARRHGLRADVHEPPLVEQVVVKIDAAGLDRVENVLRPGHEQPDDRAFFLRDGPQDPFRLHARSKTALLPEIELPNQCIFAPVW